MQRIMVATDFSNSAFDAAVLAARVARRHGAKLLIFHAQEVAEPNAVPGTREQVTEAVAESEHLLGEQADRLRRTVGDDLTIETKSTIGSPAPAIVEFAAAWQADLIAMGSLGAGGATSHPEFGSVASVVCRRAHCPVLVSRLDQPSTVPAAGAFKSPTVVIDDSAYAHPAAALAASLSEPGTEVELVHGFRATDNPIEDATRTRSEDLQRLAELAPRVDGTAVGLTLTSSTGRFSDQLLNFVGTSSDLLVVGAAPEQEAGILGPIADRLLRVSPVPVAVIPRPALENG